MIEDKILQLQRERENSPATFEIMNAMNREHRLTRSYVIENGLKLDRLENRVENLENDVKEIKSDVSTLKTDVSTLKDSVSEILQILKKES